MIIVLALQSNVCMLASAGLLLHPTLGIAQFPYNRIP
jgi:hypothetical protein